MKLLRLLPFALLAVSVPASAERLVFDHRLYPPLKQVLDSGNGDMVNYDTSKPGYVVDVIAVQGRSATDWTEALEIVVRRPGRRVGTVRDWMQEIGEAGAKRCPGELAVLAEDSNSVTFIRRSPGCTALPAQTAIYRVVAGRRSLFLLGAMTRTEMTEASQNQWLQLLASARIE